MFGYIKINKDEMKVKDYRTYKGVYCTLCHTMGEEYGWLARFTLNYDFAFLAMLRLSSEESTPCFKDAHCAFNPLVKCKQCTTHTEIFSEVAAVATLMFYYKLRDNISDEHFFKRFFSWMTMQFFNSNIKKAKKVTPQVLPILEAMSSEQYRVEGSESSIDACAHPSATALAKIFSLDIQDETQKEILYRLGYCLGRYVYFADAMDDYNTDMAKCSFNPFHRTAMNLRSEVPSVVRHSIGETMSAYYLLTPNRYSDILNNIITKGLSYQVQRIEEEQISKERQEKYDSL